MDNEILTEKNHIYELLELFRSDASDEKIREVIEDYHDNDIAEAFTELDESERARLYKVISKEKLSDIFSYIDDADDYIRELDVQDMAEIIGEMDSDDAADLLDELDDSTQEEVIKLLDDEKSAEINMLQSYSDDEIGSIMSMNFIEIKRSLTIKQAMNELVAQAGEHDNIYTIYVCDDDGTFYGAIDLKDLITARNYAPLESLIATAYPCVKDHELISDSIERIKDYAEDSLPVVNSDGKIVGIITAQDVIEVVDDEMGDDYAKLAGLTEESDLHETTIESMKKRLPWLIILLFLGLVVSSVVGAFETVVAVLPIVICFQSLILDMAGNVGTQSLAVTIRVLMDENLTVSEKLKLVVKEMRIGMANGLFLGSIACVFIGFYVMLVKGSTPVNAFLISGCVGVSLLVAMIVSSLVGTLIPMFFHKIKVDPAVASGPLITTVNDLVAVVTYYGLSWILLINLFKIV